MSAVPPRLDADWLHEGALATLLALLDRDGEEARVVGGAVRNTLLAEPLGDVDIATTATPDQVIARVEAAGAAPAAAGQELVLDEIEQALRAEIHDYAEPAVAIFRGAPPTRDGLLAAADQVEQMRIRMISPDRMQAVADQARRIIANAGC